MSVSSILAFVLAGVAAKNRRADRRDENRIAELEARVAELEDAIATANAQARRDQELIDIWRARALANIPAPQVAGPDFRPRELANAQALQWAQAQQQAQQAQQLAQQAQLAQYQGLQNYVAQQSLGQAQGLFNDPLWCNCVPARHDLFLRGA